MVMVAEHVNYSTVPGRSARWSYLFRPEVLLGTAQGARHNSLRALGREVVWKVFSANLGAASFQSKQFGDRRRQVGMRKRGGVGWIFNGSWVESETGVKKSLP